MLFDLVYAINKILTERLQEKEEMVRQLTEELQRMKKDFEKFQTVIDNETYGKLETKEPELLQQQEEQM